MMYRLASRARGALSGCGVLALRGTPEQKAALARRARVGGSRRAARRIRDATMAAANAREQAACAAGSETALRGRRRGCDRRDHRSRRKFRTRGCRRQDERRRAQLADLAQDLRQRDDDEAGRRADCADDHQCRAETEIADRYRRSDRQPDPATSAASPGGHQRSNHSRQLRATVQPWALRAQADIASVKRRLTQRRNDAAVPHPVKLSTRPIVNLSPIAEADERALNGAPQHGIKMLHCNNQSATFPSYPSPRPNILHLEGLAPGLKTTGPETRI